MRVRRLGYVITGRHDNTLCRRRRWDCFQLTKRERRTTTIGGALFGFDISSMSGVLGTRAYQNYFNNPVSYAQGGITAAMPAGSLVGSLGSSFIADKYSRKFALQVACVLWVIGAIIQCASINRGMLCAGRVIGGMSIGIASSIVPVYQSEIAPKEIRGRVVSLQQWAITWGILIQYFIQYGASNVRFFCVSSVSHQFLKLLTTFSPGRRWPQRPQPAHVGLPHPVGRANVPRRHPLRRPLFFALQPAVAGVQGPVGGGAACAGQPARRRPHQPPRPGPVPGDQGGPRV